MTMTKMNNENINHKLELWWKHQNSPYELFCLQFNGSSYNWYL